MVISVFFDVIKYIVNIDIEVKGQIFDFSVLSVDFQK